MSPVGRKKIEDVAKAAGIQEDDIPIIVDMEMRMTMAIEFRNKEKDAIEMMVMDFMICINFWNSNKYICFILNVFLKFRQQTLRNWGKTNICWMYR